jgi:hypothetical protein
MPHPLRKAKLLACAIAVCLAGCAGPGIEPQADAVLRAMSARLAAADQLTIRGQSLLARAGRLRQEAEDAAEVTALLKRPDRLAQHVRGRGGEQRAYYDGNRFTVLDVRGNGYATIAGPPTVDGLVEMLDRDYGLVLPLADFVVSDPYASLTRNLTHGAYIGMQDLGGRSCHHLAFDEEYVAWELWVSVEESLPVRQVAVGKEMDGQARLAFDFAVVDVAAELDDAVFRFGPPEGAREAQLERLPSKQ